MTSIFQVDSIINPIILLSSIFLVDIIYSLGLLSLHTSQVVST